MIPQQWASPCRNTCTNKCAKLMQIPCLEECDELCYKDPVLKGRKWSAYFDRSPGAAVNSEEFFHACVSGCGYKFDIPTEKVDEVRSNRPPKPPPLPKPTQPPVGPSTTTEDVTSTSA
ncbi:uncharacterized protein LOC122277775 isoform X3 [Carya illinoinensis]|uniref:uncharacterized protein LOC122277775 isoform X3 n=1 Tax=Carya illinoinensis TaxID=32201 RepID=UPI001C722A47|nr:uncharacterized protein LOC122277775 isoform X3 [Carya illinoinensis]XP_042943845.1 uncharacterized protein LOC122277775 isoform X3 [Carya illinoinensis]